MTWILLKWTSLESILNSMNKKFVSPNFSYQVYIVWCWKCKRLWRRSSWVQGGTFADILKVLKIICKKLKSVVSCLATVWQGPCLQLITIRLCLASSIKYVTLWGEGSEILLRYTVSKPRLKRDQLWPIFSNILSVWPIFSASRGLKF